MAIVLVRRVFCHEDVHLVPLHPRYSLDPIQTNKGYIIKIGMKLIRELCSMYVDYKPTKNRLPPSVCTSKHCYLSYYYYILAGTLTGLLYGRVS